MVAPRCPSGWAANGGGHQPLDLIAGEVLARPAGGIGVAAHSHLNSGWLGFRVIGGSPLVLLLRYSALSR